MSQLRQALAVVSGLAALGSAFFASSDCCERVNVLARTGLVAPGCLGLTAYRIPLAVLSLSLLVVTVALSLRGQREPGVLRTLTLSTMAAVAALLLFVIP